MGQPNRRALVAGPSSGLGPACTGALVGPAGVAELTIDRVAA
jgi:hypothetical protein